MRKVRLACDLRHWNDKLVTTAWPLPAPEKAILKLGDATVYSRWDFRSAFWSVALSPKAQQILSFRTEKAQWAWLRLPFGLAEASSTFTFLINQMLSRIKDHKIFAYIDDVCLASTEPGQHLKLIRSFLECVKDAGIKIAVDKSEVMVDQIKLIGYNIKNGRVSITEDRKQAILKLSYPKTIKQLRKTLGCINFIRSHCEHLASHLSPFYDMLKSPGKIKDTEQLRELFEVIKRKLVEAPHLSIFNENLQTVIKCDASSKHGWSLIVFNEKPDKTREPVCYLSGRWSKCEKRMCVSKLELNALFRGLQRAEYMLFGRHLICETDSKVLTYLFTAREMSAYTARRIEFLNSRFKIEFRHIPTAENNSCDLLSRHTDEAEPECRPECSIEWPCSECSPFVNGDCLAVNAVMQKDRLGLHNGMCKNPMKQARRFRQSTWRGQRDRSSRSRSTETSAGRQENSQKNSKNRLDSGRRESEAGEARVNTVHQTGCEPAQQHIPTVARQTTLVGSNREPDSANGQDSRPIGRVGVAVDPGGVRRIDEATTRAEIAAGALTEVTEFSDEPNCPTEQDIDSSTRTDGRLLPGRRQPGAAEDDGNSNRQPPMKTVGTEQDSGDTKRIKFKKSKKGQDSSRIKMMECQANACITTATPTWKNGQKAH